MLWTIEIEEIESNIKFDETSYIADVKRQD